MGRITKGWGPAGFCDFCGKPCITLCQAGGPELDEPGIRCYHCRQGYFRHRALWYMVQCPVCGGKDYGCETCSGDGVMPAPID